MRKIIALLLGLFVVFNMINAQNIIVFNFDGVTPSFSSWSDTFVSESNPVSDGVNSSANVGKYTNYNQWSNVETNVNIDPRIYTSFEIDVHSPAAGTVVVACFDAGDNQLDWYSQAVSASSEWIKFSRTLKFTTRIAKIRVSFNFGESPKGNSEDNVYLDNLVFLKSPSEYLNLYYETFYASWSQWSSWTGAPSTRAGSWFGKINLQSDGDADITLNRDWDSYEHNLWMSPTSPTLTFPNINITGFDNIRIVFDNIWPWSDAENGTFWGSSAAQRTPLVEYKSGDGDWNVLTVGAFWNGWQTQTIAVDDIDLSQPLSIRFSSADFTYKLDNVRMQGKIKYRFTGATNSDPTVATNWFDGFIPPTGSDLTLENGTLVLDDDATYNTMTVNPGAKLTVNSGKTLELSSLVLQSDVTGTATFVNSGTSTVTSAIVNQYLPVTDRNWYLASPVAVVASSVLNTGSSVVEYNEETGQWVTVDGNLNPMKGYISVSGDEGAGTISFEGTLNDGEKEIILSRKGDAKAGFNLVGNPYPSYLKWTEELANSANCLTTIWYRTKSDGVYSFQTYNASGDLGVPLSTSGYIPPMQAFWVKTEIDGSTLTVDNSMRSHGDGSSNLLKAPSINNKDRKILRLQVSNGDFSDETVLYFNENASDGFDSYDSPKMSGSSLLVPEIYSIVDGEHLVINGMNEIPDNISLPIGIKSGNATSLYVIVSQMLNFVPGTQVLIIDSQTGNSKDISDGSAYSFDSSLIDEGRFSLMFKSPSTTTSVNPSGDNEKNVIVLVREGRINIQCNDILSVGVIAMYNSLGQKVLEQTLQNELTVINNRFEQGIYFVNVTLNGKSITEKIVLK